jgi:hypothetical protein
MKPRRAWVWLIVVTLVAAACSSSESPQAAPSSSTTAPGTSGGTQVIEPEEPVPTTAWEQVLAGVADPMPLQTAIDAFSVAFRPIDGATPTNLEPGYSGSGSGPLRWILGHWDELNPTQQGQVEVVLADWESGATASAGPLVLASISPFSRRATSAGAPQALVDDMVVNIETLLGRTLSVPVVAKAAPSNAAVDDAYAMTVPRDAAGGFAGHLASCSVVFAPDGLALTGSDLVALAAHEVFHCFEYDLGTVLQSGHRPAWIVEGMAEWVGETIAGGSSLSTGTWKGWLDHFASQPLFDRAYTAIGFYSHVDDSGVELWERLDQAILASDTSSEAAYQVLIEGGSADLVDSWAPGYFREPARAPVWDQSGPGITLDAPDIGEVVLHEESAVSISAAPYAAAFLEVDAVAEVVTFESPGEGLALLADGTTVELEELHGAALCTTGSCACSEGTSRAGTVFTPTSPGVISIGATGHVFGSEVTVIGWSLERFCQAERCQVGTWESGVWDVPRVIAGGYGIPLVITPQGEGWVDWSQAADLYGVVQGGTSAGAEILPLRLVLSGASHFFVEPQGTGLRVTASAGSLGITPYLDFGNGWFETSGESAYVGLGKIGGEATFACAGNTMYLNGAIQFWRVSTDAVIPGQAADLTPTTVVGGGSPTTSGALPPVDPCALLTLGEVQQLEPDATAPAGPDDLQTTFLSQCTFALAVAVQVYGPDGPEFFTSATEIFGVTILDLPGIGDWALAEINKPDPTFGIEASVVLVAAGTATGMVALVPYSEVFPGTPEFDALVALLELAISRL